MGFNELNSVEHCIIHQLSGVNLNHSHWAEEKTPYGFQWSYKSADKLKRGVNEVIEEEEKDLISDFASDGLGNDRELL